MCPTNLTEKVEAFFATSRARPNHRYLSWEHCYQFFRSRGPDAIAADIDTAALSLAFYLASWGMYRGSSFLLQHDYAVHRAAIERLVSEDFRVFWTVEIGSSPHDPRIVDAMLALVEAVKRAYDPFRLRET